MFKPFFIAIQFLTIIPVPAIKQYSEDLISRSMHYYMLTGLLIGALLYSLSLAAPFLSTDLLAGIIVVFWVIITGALHIDGLADMSDAWVGSHGDKQKFLDIMKDPYCGPVGATAILSVLLLKFLAIKTLLTQDAVWVLIFIPAFTRLGASFLLIYTRYLRKQGLGTPLTRQKLSVLYWLQLVTLTAVLFYISGFYLWPVIVIAVCGHFIFRLVMLKKLGGITGDITGAYIEIFETSFLLAFSIFFLVH